MQAEDGLRCSTTLDCNGYWLIRQCRLRRGAEPGWVPEAATRKRRKIPFFTIGGGRNGNTHQSHRHIDSTTVAKKHFRFIAVNGAEKDQPQGGVSTFPVGVS